MTLNLLLTGIGAKNVDMQLLPKAQEAGQTILQALYDVPPFPRLDREQFEDYLMQAFSEEVFADRNDYIREAAHRKDLAYFSFFLHHSEMRLNSIIYRFLTRNGIDRCGSVRFLDYKLDCLQMLLFCRMMGEASFFASLVEYRRVRQSGAICNSSGKSRAEVISEFAVQSGYKDESISADELLTIAQRNRSIVSLYRTEQDEDSEEIGAVDFEGTTASGAERFCRRTLDKLRLKLLESGTIHTVTLKQTETQKKSKK